MIRLPEPRSGESPVPHTEIRETDVLCGRGASYNNFAGNKAFHLLIQEHFEGYVWAKRRSDKAAIAHSIVDKIEQSHGRFLRKITSWREAQQYGLDMDKEHWLPLPPDSVVEKTKQAFRDESSRQARRANSNSPRSLKSESPPPRDTLYSAAMVSLMSQEHSAAAPNGGSVPQFTWTPDQEHNAIDTSLEEQLPSVACERNLTGLLETIAPIPLHTSQPSHAGTTTLPGFTAHGGIPPKPLVKESALNPSASPSYSLPEPEPLPWPVQRHSVAQERRSSCSHPWRDGFESTASMELLSDEQLARLLMH